LIIKASHFFCRFFIWPFERLTPIDTNSGLSLSSGYSLLKRSGKSRLKPQPKSN